MIDDELAMQEAAPESSDDSPTPSPADGEPNDDIETPEKTQASASRQQ